jgi:ADP-heptose:LPS heptosyltransferase
MVKIHRMRAQWIGEFGHEIAGFQAYMRKLSKDQDIEITCFEGNEYLYKDFAVKITTVKKPYNYEPDSWMDKSGYNYGNKDFEIPPGTRVIDTFQPNIIEKQDFIKLGDPTKYDYDVIIHSRNTDKTGSAHYNWGKTNYELLTYRLMKHNIKVAIIGTKEMSNSLTFTDDYRGADLETTCNLLASSKMIVGESSGPIHLASLCGTPQIVWSGLERSEMRYKKHWNFHNSDVDFLFDKNWNPDVDVIFNKIMDKLCNI